ncbi:MAG: hypothetical protein IJW05_13985 [Lentisphaeria bacterium]|nr:hypothetical protein [Lentisphaeria bacterium]
MLKIELGEKMEKICNEDAPECFGQGKELLECETCIYRESCQFCAEDAKRMKIQDSKWYHYSEYIDNCSPSTENILPVDISDNRTYTRDEVIALSAFLLRIGKDRKLGKILSAKLMGAKSFAEIARNEGVTRQAIHKRIGKQLAKLFGYKNRQLTDSRLLTLDTEEFRLLKLSRAGVPEDDIKEILELPNTKFNQLKERLDYKLTRWT